MIFLGENALSSPRFYLSCWNFFSKIGSHGVAIYRINSDLMYRIKKETEFTEVVRAYLLETMKLYQKEKGLITI